MKKSNLKNRYTTKDYSEKTVEQMDLLIQSLEENFVEIDKGWISSLDLLALNFELMFQAYDDIKQNGHGAIGSRGRLTKNPAITVFLNTQNAISNLLSKTGLTVLSKARVKKYLNEEAEDDDFAETFLKD